MKGKVVLVAGADGGLGVHVTKAFLDAGAIVGRNIAEDPAVRFSKPGVHDHTRRRRNRQRG